MTTVYERTRSVIDTSNFLLRLIRDKSLPDTVRSEARLLLRHYPNADTVRRAGRWEAIRQDEVSKLPGSPKALHPALATWPLLEPFFPTRSSQTLLNWVFNRILPPSPHCPLSLANRAMLSLRISKYWGWLYPQAWAA